MKEVIFMLNMWLDDEELEAILFMEHSSDVEGLTEMASSKTGTFMKPGGGLILAVKD